MTGRIIVIGAIIMDVKGTSTLDILPADSNPGTVRMSFGGVGRNIAHNLCLLGEKPEFLTAIAKDAFGQMMEAHCRGIGIGLDLAIRPANAASGVYLYVTGPEKDLYVGVVDLEIAKELTSSVIRERLPELNRADAVVVDGNLTEETLRFIAEEVRTPLFADPVSCRKAVKLNPILSKLHTIKPNRLEAEALTGEKDPLKAAELLHRSGVKNVFVSCGAGGMAVASDHFSGMLESFPITVRNTNGAGDAAMAGLIKAYLRGMDVPDAARFAMAAGAIAASSEETVSPDLSEAGVLNRINRNGPGTNGTGKESYS